MAEFNPSQLDQLVLQLKKDYQALLIEVRQDVGLGDLHPRQSHRQFSGTMRIRILPLEAAYVQNRWVTPDPMLAGFRVI